MSKQNYMELIERLCALEKDVKEYYRDASFFDEKDLQHNTIEAVSPSKDGLPDVDPTACICTVKEAGISNMFFLFSKRACPYHGHLWKAS